MYYKLSKPFRMDLAYRMQQTTQKVLFSKVNGSTKRCNKAANYWRATYIFQSPSWVHNRLNLAFFPEIEHGFHDAFGIGGTILLVQQVAQIQARECLVLIKQFDWRHLVYLPPLEHTWWSYSVTSHSNLQKTCLSCQEIAE